jgi:hypothetical protein
MTFIESLQKHNDFEVLYKNSSPFMKLLGKILFFNKTFMTRYTTTIGNKIYVPNEKYLTSNRWLAEEIIAHEYVHVVDCKRYGPVRFAMLYLFPQVLALLALLTIPAAFLISWWALLFLLFLLCAAPLPAYWRRNFELRGYTMSLFVIAQQMVKNRKPFPDQEIKEELLKTAETIDRIYFRGSAYYFMWPFGVMPYFEKQIDQIISGDISETDEVFVHVMDALKQD